MQQTDADELFDIDRLRRWTLGRLFVNPDTMLSLLTSATLAP